MFLLLTLFAAHKTTVAVVILIVTFMAILKEETEVDHQLFVVIPCQDLMPPSPSQREEDASKPRRKNMLTETDFEAAQQLLQLSSHSQSHSRNSAANGEDSEDASSCFPPKSSSPPTRKKKSTLSATLSAPKIDDGVLAKERHLTALDTRDILERGERRRYKPIEYIYRITSPLDTCAPSRSAKKRKQKQLADV